MTGAGAIVPSGDRSHPDPVTWEGNESSLSVSGERESSFRDAWSSLEDQIDENRSKTDVETRLTTDCIERAFEIAHEFPEFVTISTGPYGRNEDMVRHVEHHFDSLFNDTDFATEFKKFPSRPAFDPLFDMAEIVYLSDCVGRFAEKTVFTPDVGGIPTLSFIELPPELSHWMERVEVVWACFGGELRISEWSPRKAVEELYDDREEFVEKAVEADMFLPIPPEDEVSVTNVRNRVETLSGRRANVSPALIHDYCYDASLEFLD